MSVYELGDYTGIPLDNLDDTLTYMEGFGMVDHRQGYWVCPDRLDPARATRSG
ncbi:hypothetical protein M0R89_09150 [Halorussus limi]|uniref:Uncharacterized protein n=1 Tax=Halorussus limi TaxID=2938695 RepID=A0A8U0HZW3_9EURY|nr:hypothetical protein [Halorussus limi]UPV76201.1 hypothetical protein M0R89_09150 [Halorussus limi]